MADITQKTDISSNGVLPTIVGGIWDAFEALDNVLISEGAANARIRKAEMLSAKSDEELAAMDVDREDVFRVAFRDKFDL